MDFHDRREEMVMDFHDRRTGEVVHLPPHPGAIERIYRAAAEENVRREMHSFGAFQRATEETEASAGPYGMGSKKELRTHMLKAHGAWPEDFDDHDAPNRWHAGWHKDLKSWGTEDHTHA